jgi:hypothetical protein
VSAPVDVIASCVAFFRPMAPLSGVETRSACCHLPCRSDRSFCPSLNFPGDTLPKTRTTLYKCIKNQCVVSVNDEKVLCFSSVFYVTTNLKLICVLFIDISPPSMPTLAPTSVSSIHLIYFYVRILMAIHRQ